jgi:hypothetical protein
VFALSHMLVQAHVHVHSCSCACTHTHTHTHAHAHTHTHTRTRTRTHTHTHTHAPGFRLFDGVGLRANRHACRSDVAARTSTRHRGRARIGVARLGPARAQHCKRTLVLGLFHRGCRRRHQVSFCFAHVHHIAVECGDRGRCRLLTLSRAKTLLYTHQM